MKGYWIQVTVTREAYVTIKAENEAEAGEESSEMDSESFDWESHGIEIESIEEKEAGDTPP
jgi:hypothetical protein